MPVSVNGDSPARFVHLGPGSLCLGDYLGPPRQVGGRAPRDALGRHPPADPRRWRTAGGPVAGAQLGIEPLDAKPVWHQQFSG
jgi:hypothetical protein